MKKIDFTIISIFSVLLLYLCNMCSPLYPTNWWCDANIFQVIGNEIWNGKILYHDIFDQKGPVLFALHALGRMAGVKSFLGVWILLILSGIGFLTGMMKTIMLWIRRELALPLTILFGALTYSSIFYGYGDTSEEWSLPVLMWSIYLFFRYAKQYVVPNRIESVLLGLGIALVFWNKFSITLTFGGEVLAAIIIAFRRHELKSLIPPFVYAMGTFVAFSLVLIGVFWALGAAGDLINGYFVFNLMHYTTNAEGIGYKDIPRALLLLWGTLVSLFAIIPEKCDVRVMASCSFAAASILFFVVYCWFYYYLTLFVFLPLLAMAFRSCPVTNKTVSAFWVVALLIGSLSISYCYNICDLSQHKHGSFGSDFAERILADDAVEGQGELMLYNHQNPSIFLLTNYPTQLFYFFRPNSHYPAIMEEQNNHLNARIPKWVVTADTLSVDLGYERVCIGKDYNRNSVPNMFVHRDVAHEVYLYKRIN